MSDTPSLGQRWVAACRRAGVEPWAAGMLDTRGDRVLCAHGVIVVTDEVSPHYGGYVERESVGLVPDLSDPATAGAAIGVLRAWGGEPTLHPRPSEDGWHIERLAPSQDGECEWLRESGQWGRGETMPICAATEAEAVVAAAEALAARGER